MESLHDLIYSQQSENQEESRGVTEPPRQLSAAAKRQRAAATEMEPFAAKSQQQVDTPSKERLPPTKPDFIISNGIERRRKKKRGRPSKRRRHDEEEEEDVWETQSQAERRIRKTELKWEYKDIQTRWKERVYSVQHEVDYGNSVRTMARKVLKQRQQNEQHDDQKPAAISSPHPPEMELNSSDEEQQEALGSLWTSMTQEDDKDESNEEEKPDDPNDFHAWHYHELGFNAPRDLDLQDFYYTRAARTLGKNAVQVNLPARAKRLKNMEPVTWTPVRNDPLRNVAEERYYLETDMPTTCYTRLRFHHISSLRAMALRVLSASAGNSVELENRLLRDLYSTPTQTVGRDYHVMTQAMERGCDFVLFRSHEWKQRAVVARTLGMTADLHRTGPPTRNGFSMERHDVDKEGRDLRKKTVNLLSNGEIPHQAKPNGNAETNHEECGEVDMDTNENDGDAFENMGLLDENQDDADDQSDLRREDDEVDATPIPSLAKVEVDEEMNSNTPVSNSNYPDAASFRSYLGTDVDYVHTAGTQPPVPRFPLDETGILIGGEDRYSQVYHNAKIDEATFNVTLSVLLTRLGKARLKGDPCAIEDVQEQILSFINEISRENVIQQQKFHYRRRKRSQYPSALHFKTMMGFCSFVANHGSTSDAINSHNPADRLYKSHRDDLGENRIDEDSDEDESFSLRGAPTPNMKLVAQTIYDRCAECPGSMSLTLFPRIHITVGITLIAKHLPSSAAEILSRPFGELSCRTPFEIMRTTMEHLEENELLTDSYAAHSNGDLISAGYLEHIMNQASEIFKQASDIDPTDVVCNAWYLSSLFASLLLCSGNAIDGKAHLCPSSKQEEDDYDMIFSQPDPSTGESNRHEVRQKMSKFAVVRKRVASSLKEAVLVALRDMTSSWNLMVSSALEWKQAMALLVGPRSKVQTIPVFSDIRRLHSHFTVQWAMQENSPLHRNLIEDMEQERNASHDNVLESLATAVENNPSDIFAWRRLVRALGPAGTAVSSRQPKECKRSSCFECSRLRKGLNIDHVALRESRQSHWWGKGRVSWWANHVLALESRLAENTSANEIYRVRDIVEKYLKDEITSNIFDELDPAEDIAMKASEGVHVACEEPISWLDEVALSHEDAISDIGDDIVSDDFANDLLPNPLETVIRAATLRDESSASLVCGSSNECDLELLCYKIIVACHLYGISHDSVAEGVWKVAQECWKANTDSNEWRSLVWLSSMGISVPQILHDLYTQVQRRVKGASSYPEEEKEAIRLGLEIFGKEWVKIRDYFKVFEGSSRAHLKHVYKSMKSYGEL